MQTFFDNAKTRTFNNIPVGISGNLLRLLQNYLSNRKQRVVLNDSYFDYSSIESGVPQGSVLGPLKFLVYFNHCLYK